MENAICPPQIPDVLVPRPMKRRLLFPKPLVLNPEGGLSRFRSDFFLDDIEAQSGPQGKDDDGENCAEGVHSGHLHGDEFVVPVEPAHGEEGSDHQGKGGDVESHPRDPVKVVQGDV